jgi:hypothetical protein
MHGIFGLGTRPIFSPGGAGKVGAVLAEVMPTGCSDTPRDARTRMAGRVM